MKVLHILQADNIVNDYRIIKQTDFQTGKGYKVRIFYFNHNNNKSSNGKLNNGTLYFSKSLLSRKFFIPGRFIFLKLIEQYYHSIKQILKFRPNQIIFHDERFFGLIIFIKPFIKMFSNTKIKWDLRELPEYLINGKLKRILLDLCLISSDKISFANKERAKLINKISSVYDQNKIAIIQNFPDKKFFNIKLTKQQTLKFNSFIKKKYFYIQSPLEPNRYFFNSIAALRKFKDLHIVLSGRIKDSDIKKLDYIYGNEMKFINFTGLIDPYFLPYLIDNALGSIVLYTEDYLNSKYCAPNRLYQSLSQGIPVIVGSNPPMRNIIRKYNLGISLKSDGRNIKDIVNGIEMFLKQKKKLIRNAKKFKNKFSWESQISELEKFLT